jgi:hypothetical protein
MQDSVGLCAHVSDPLLAIMAAAAHKEPCAVGQCQATFDHQTMPTRTAGLHMLVPVQARRQWKCNHSQLAQQFNPGLLYATDTCPSILPPQ